MSGEGKTTAQAEAALDEAGLLVGELIYAPEAEGVRGTVIAQQPAAGKRVQPHSSVMFTIAGAEILTVPSLEGLAPEEAASALTASGFVVGAVTEEFHSTMAAGSVVAQNPEPGTRADRNSGVSFVLSKGKDMRTVPDVVGLTKTDAEQVLKTAGFTVTTQKVESSGITDRLPMHSAWATSTTRTPTAARACPRARSSASTPRARRSSHAGEPG